MDFYEEACSLSTSDAEPDSDFEDDAPETNKTRGSTQKSPNLDWDDPQALLDTWLGELDNIRMGLETGGGATAVGGVDVCGGPRPLSVPDVEKLQLQEPRIDSYRFSMANLEDSQDGELDAILKELCALGSQFDQELKDKSPTPQTARTPSSPDSMFSKRLPHSMITSSASKPKLDITTMSNISDSVADPVHRVDSGLRTESPDNDSAFSDSISMLSSESSASSGASAARTDASKASATSGTSSAFASSSSASSGAVPDAAARLKAEKIRLALEKMREANVKKLFVKAFTADGSTKSLLVDEKMTVGHVIRLLADKNHVRMEPKWSLIEQCTDLHMERIYEDHELLVDQLMLWTRDSRNTLLFLERSEKYALFSRPEEFLLSGTNLEKDQSFDDDSRANLLEEFFSSTGVGVPDIEGPLFLKAEGKKAWKRYYFVLRASGLYYSPKGKSRSLKDLVCLATFDVNQVYGALNWRKKYKAPTDFGFAIKHPKLQSKSTKFIKYLCADDERSYRRWMMGIRIAKNGKYLHDNYKALVDDLAQEDLDQLANARSFSLASMSITPTTEEIPKRLDGSRSSTPVNTLDRGTAANLGRSRGSLSSSSGCPSELSGSSTPTLESGFDCDFPTGTIKRKPSMTPKIPLTSTTRLLVKEVEDTVDGDITNSGMNVSRNTQRQSFRKSLTEEVNIVRRKSSLSPCLPEGVAVGIPADAKKEEVDELPLPPPPEVAAEEISGPESLPPPPPEAFEGVPDASSKESVQPVSKTLSLPPPAPALRSKPPSPTPVVLKPCLKPSSSTSSTAPRVPPKPSVGCFPRRESSEHNIYANTESKSPTKKTRRITFDDSPTVEVVSKPPPPPKRVETLRSSSRDTTQLPQKLNSPGCAVTPPKEFLKDLQRVMQKKWQVAQKCKAELETTSHEVLGFRDVPPPTTPLPTAYRENNVRAWVAEHYGPTGATPHPDQVGLAYFESVFVPSGKRDIYPSSAEPGREYPHPYLPQQPQQQLLSSRMSTASASSGSSSSKKLAPPPPKRSDTTHLSTRIH